MTYLDVPSLALALQLPDGGQAPFWSPDGQSLGFFADGKLKRLNADGTVRIIANAPGAASGATWNADDVIVFARSALGPLFRTSASGGTPVEATHQAPSHRGHVQPHFLRDGRHFVFGVNGSASVRGIYVGELDNDTITRIADVDATTPRVMDNHLLFVSAGKLLAQPFDLGRLATTGPAAQVADSIAGAPGVSIAGTMAFRTGSAVVRRQLVWFDRDGRELNTVGEVDTAAPTSPSLSPNGRLLALSRNIGGNPDIWTVDVTRGALNRVTSNDATDNFPVWSPDGRELVFGSTRSAAALDLYRTRLGSGNEQLLLSTDQIKDAEDWSRDGKFVLYRSVDLQTGNDLWVLPMDGGKPIPIARTAFDERGGQFSPDGRWVAYQSDESGRFEVYVQPFPGPGQKIPVSTGGGAQVRWRSDGNELFYVALDSRLMAVPIKAATVSGTIDVGTAAPLFRTRLGGAPVFGVAVQQYAVSADGQRFLLNAVVDSVPSPIAVVLNWTPTP